MSGMGELVGMGLFFGFFVFIIIIIIKKRKSLNFSFKCIPLRDTTFKPLKKMIKNNGQKVKKGRLFFGFKTIHKVIAFCEMKGKKPHFNYDSSRNVFLEDETKSNDQDFIAFLVASGFLKLRREIYIVNRDKINVKYDQDKKRWFLPENITWYSFGDIWVADQPSKDFVKDLSMSFFDESIQTHLINYPNRVVALETEHAKRISIIKEKVESERGKYQNPESVSETETTEGKQ